MTVYVPPGLVVSSATSTPKSRADLLLPTQGLISESFPRACGVATGFVFGNAVLRASMFGLLKDDPVSSIVFEIMALGATPANAQSLYSYILDSNGNVLGSGQAASAATAVGSVGEIAVPLSQTFNTPSDGSYYGAVLIFGTTGAFPTVRSSPTFTTSLSQNFGKSPAAAKTGLSDVGNAAGSVPSPTGITSSSVEFWLAAKA